MTRTVGRCFWAFPTLFLRGPEWTACTDAEWSCTADGDPWPVDDARVCRSCSRWVELCTVRPSAYPLFQEYDGPAVATDPHETLLAGAEPVPPSWMVRSPIGAGPVIVSSAARGPNAFGVNVTPKAQACAVGIS